MVIGLVGAFVLGAACCALVLRRRDTRVGLPVIVAGVVTGVACLAALPQTASTPTGLLESGGPVVTTATEATETTTQATETTTQATETTTQETDTTTTGTTAPTPTLPSRPVVAVIDGDTLDVLEDDARLRVRLIGINAPERGECHADVATRTLQQLVADEQVILTADTNDRDRYDRLLRYIHLPDGRFVNELLVEAGAARAVSYPPDTTHDAVLAAAQVRAQQAEVGIWAPDACGTPTTADVGFSAAVFDPPGDDLDPVTGERVTLVNRATVAIDLTDWVIADEGPHRFRFPAGFTLDPGGTVTVYSACGVDKAAFLYWCNQGSAVWNNSGDTAFLWDPLGNIVDSTGPVGSPPMNR